MTLYIMRGAHDKEVADNLYQIANVGSGLAIRIGDVTVPDPDGGAPAIMGGDGRVSFSTPAPAIPSIGETLLRDLAGRTDIAVYVRGEGPAWGPFTTAEGQKHLVDAAGITFSATRDGQAIIQIIYDVTGCLDVDGTVKGYQIVNTKGDLVANPTHVILFHELVHAYRKASHTETSAGTTRAEKKAAIELQVIGDHPGENDYRLSRSLDVRSLNPMLNHVGKGQCSIVAPAKPTPKVTSSTGDCFVATAAYGSPIGTPVQFLREFRDNILMTTRAGRAFFDSFYAYYYQFSPAIADAMRADDDMNRAVRIALVEPLVRYLDLFISAPLGSVEHLPEPWRTHLLHEQQLFDNWAANFNPDTTFDGLAPAETARELAVYLRYILRNPERRERYLALLETQSQIPLRVNDRQRAQVLSILTDSGCPPEVTKRILAAPDSVRDHVRRDSIGLGLLANMNVDEQPDPGQNSDEFFYTLTLRNSTQIVPPPDPNDPNPPPPHDPLPVTIDWRGFYKRKNLPGVVYVEALNCQPGGPPAVIPLGVCGQMESYAFAAFSSIYDVGQGKEIYGPWFFSGQDLVDSNGDPIGDITPEKANQWAHDHGRNDTDTCADSYELTS